MKNMIVAAAVALTTAFVPVTADAFSVRRDHQLHMAAGIAVYGAARTFGYTPTESLIACGVVGLAKEGADMLGLGRPEVSDVVATVALCAVAALVENAVADRPRRFRAEPQRNVAESRREIISFYRTIRPLN